MNRYFNSTNPLLMLVDLQQAIDDPSWGKRNNPNAEQQIGLLLSKWREYELPVLHVKHMSTDIESTYSPQHAGNQFKTMVTPLDSEEVLEKNTNSAFIGTHLHESLQQKGISELVIVGVITNNSIEATVRMAGNLGYATTVVCDGTFTFNLIDFKGTEHSAETIHNISLANLQGEYANVLTTKEVVLHADSLFK